MMNHGIAPIPVAKHATAQPPPRSAVASALRTHVDAKTTLES
jgi:hypothetical protein